MPASRRLKGTNHRSRGIRFLTLPGHRKQARKYHHHTTYKIQGQMAGRGKVLPRRSGPAHSGKTRVRSHGGGSERRRREPGQPAGAHPRSPFQRWHSECPGEGRFTVSRSGWISQTGRTKAPSSEGAGAKTKKRLGGQGKTSKCKTATVRISERRAIVAAAQTPQLPTLAPPWPRTRTNGDHHHPFSGALNPCLTLPRTRKNRETTTAPAGHQPPPDNMRAGKVGVGSEARACEYLIKSGIKLRNFQHNQRFFHSIPFGFE